MRKAASRSARPGSRAAARSHHVTLSDPVVKMFVSGFLIAGIIFVSVFVYFYVKYSRMVDRRMSGPVFSNAAKIYARPKSVSVGEKLDAQEIIADLRHAGYTEQGRESDSPIGHYRWVQGGIEILPGPQSFHPPDAAVIRFSGGKVSEISATGREGDSSKSYDLEPVLVTALFEGSDRAKRQLIKFDDLPKD